jgi:hypothetical protein
MREFFKSYLRELMGFRFMFSYQHQTGYNVDIKRLLEPYLTNLWHRDRRLFARCNVQKQYTLPYPLKTMNFCT